MIQINNYMTKLSSQIVVPDLLSALVTSVARVSVLRIFLIDPRRSYYQRQLEAATGLAIRAVQRELEKLTGSGLLYRHMEGKRAYYTIDVGYRGFNELRGLFLAGATPLDVLRGVLAVDSQVHLLFRNKRSDRVLVVTRDGVMPSGVEEMDGFRVKVMSSDEFVIQLVEAPKGLNPFLKSGEDLFGRRDDIVWRRIEAAGFVVDKAKGTP
jgi:DNA-binding transcriptional ArsR family regulator